MIEIKKFTAEHFGIEAQKISTLTGYSSENYKIESAAGSFVLKFYKRSGEPNMRELLEAENLFLKRLTSSNKHSFPVPQMNTDGDFTGFDREQDKYFRLLTFVEGEMLTDVEHTPELFRGFGKFLAELNRATADFRHISTEARKFNWDLQFYRLAERHIGYIKNPEDRKLAEYFFMRHRDVVDPVAEDLRNHVIHGDANDWNVLVRDGRIAGIIDFGDIAHSPLINETAIALTYSLTGKDDPIDWALPFISEYHKILPFEEREIDVLYNLIATRLSMSVCMAARAHQTMPEISGYIIVSEKPAWELLRRWIRINPNRFTDEVRKAIGFDARISNTSKPDLMRRQKHTSRALSLQFAEPIKMFGAAFQYMYDTSGKTYLDCYNNIPQVGHNHPRVVRAGQRAMGRLNTNTRYLNDEYNEYAEKLLRMFPSRLSKVFFVNSGSAASDLAIRLALAHTKNKVIVVMEHGYHGNTRLGVEISSYKYAGNGGNGKSESIIEAAMPDTYRGKFDSPGAGKDSAGELIDQIGKDGRPIAAFIAEPVVGCGGQVPLARGYLQEVYPFIRKSGGICISDEVQTGFGRLGKFFWGFEMHGVIPDIVILGKPIGNGHPIAAVVTTDQIAESFETGMEFFSSFGGNPVSCAIGSAVLDVLDEEDLPENAEKVGRYLLSLLDGLVKKHEIVGDARGAGLFLGLELVRDKQSKEPNSEMASFIQEGLKERGILVGIDGPFENVLKIKPPICFTRENALELVENIDALLNNL